MKRTDQISGVFWLGFSIVMSIESYRLGVGSLYSPKAGFHPFLMSIILGFLSLGLIVSTIVRPTKKTSEMGEYLHQDVKFKRETFLKVLYAIILLFGYSILLNILGFLIDTALFIGFYLTKIEPQKWYVVIATAISAPLSTYIIFNVFLKVQMPRGLLWF